LVGGRPYVRSPFTRAKVEAIRAILEVQPYISGVEYADDFEGVDLDAWRTPFRWGVPIADLIAASCGVPMPNRNRRWLVCPEPWGAARVVIARSPRYHNPLFPWREVYEKYRKEAIFVGLQEEYREFSSHYRRLGSAIPFRETTIWEMFQIIAGCEVFCGNSSAPLALAIGLGVPHIVQEVMPQAPLSVWEREGVINYHDGDIELP
jgi:hypothetical protein